MSSLTLANGDHISGNLKEIAGGKAVLSGFGSSADLPIPLDRIEQISMASATAGKIKSNAADVRAYFIDQGCVTMELESWDEKQITATSPDFGKAVFSPGAFQRLQFNPGAQTISPDDDAAPGDNASPSSIPLIFTLENREIEFLSPMKNLAATLLPCVLAFAVVAHAADPATDARAKTADTLLFAGKDELHGIFLGCDKTGVRWQNPDAEEPSLFQTANLTWAKLDSRKPPAGQSPAHPFRDARERGRASRRPGFTR